MLTEQRVWFRDASGTVGELTRDQPFAVTRREHAGVCELLLKRQAGDSARFRFTLAARERRREVVRLVDAPHALAAAAGDGLDEDGVADAFCLGK